MITVGIPRGLLYYQYYPMWQTFFNELGAEVLVSPLTNQATLMTGSSRVISDTCLPVKVFCGHVLSLVDKCDHIFVPVVRSVNKKIYNCAKFLGLSDLTRAVIPEAPSILEIDFDINRGKSAIYHAIYNLGRRFTWSPFAIKRAAVLAWQAHLNYHQLMAESKLRRPEALSKLSGITDASSKAHHRKTEQTQATIAVIGHPYLLYDEHINHRLLNWLEQSNVRILTPELLTREQLTSAVTRCVGKAHWTYEEEVVGAGGHYLENITDGVIGLMTFGCGPDSLMMDVVRRAAIKAESTPFMSLTLDEHTSEVGLFTRLEAFLDMILRKKRKRIEVCV